ncbi:MAG: ABC transporter ATP-binding protein [Thermoanaerobaculum sp.]|nr:MAG: ABC transporter ATP-binding protein [Thermoanaerobaculum sp.]
MKRSSPAVVVLQEVTIRYGTVTAVSSVSLSVSAGEVVALIGPDGAGKTSLLRATAGLQPVSAGKVEVFGLEAWKHRRELHHQLGYLPQHFALYDDLSIAENLAFIGHLMGLQHWQERRSLLLQRLGLANFQNRRAQALSGGMKRKLALAASLMHDPRLLILDEPTTGVDPISRREFWRLLGEFVAEGLTLIVATPYLDEAQRANRVVLFHRGQILAQGSPRELSQDFEGRLMVVEGEPRAELAAILAELPGVLDVQPFGLGFHVMVEERALLPDPQVFKGRGVRLHRFEQIAPSLEDVFLSKLRAATGEPQP